MVDMLVSIGFFTLLYFLDRRYKFSNITIIIVTIALILGASGSLGMYNYFVIYYFGFDKLIHFTNSLAAAFILMHIVKDKHFYLKYFFVILIVAGIGSVNEINEFVGFTYLHIKDYGIFTQGDNLAEIKSDLQIYDTSFDMIFNVIGACFGIILFFIYKKTRLRNTWLSNRP